MTGLSRELVVRVRSSLDRWNSIRTAVPRLCSPPESARTGERDSFRRPKFLLTAVRRPFRRSKTPFSAVGSPFRWLNGGLSGVLEAVSVRVSRFVSVSYCVLASVEAGPGKTRVSDDKNPETNRDFSTYAIFS